jgi:hypothetical protein
MVVTCHFIDATWGLNRRVLNFCSFPPPHTGHAISQALLKCFRDWGIENKVCSVTVDNATNNDLAICEKFLTKGNCWLLTGSCFMLDVVHM